MLKRCCTLLFVFLFLFSSEPFAHANLVSETVRHGVGDVKETFFSWPVIVIGGGAIAAGALVVFDKDIQSNFSGGRNLGAFDTVSDQLGAPYVLDPAALAVFGIGKWIKDEDVALTGETLFEALMFTDAMTGGLKLAFQRNRPNGDHYGFPSLHASSTFAVATVLETLHGPMFGIPAYLLAGMISFSRIDSNVHYTSDVVFGAALGAAIGWGTARFHKKDNPDLFVMPMMGPATGLMVQASF